ncbi:MAG: hypothetical protein HQK96_16445, partial [Nitrospirae bacterium]|nr:hypothetical protein [Nitrospirota bacterium]
IFAPLAMLVMFIIRYLMFKDLFLSITLMMDAMISVIWSMRLFIGLGCTIHNNEFNGAGISDGNRNRQYAHL